MKTKIVVLVMALVTTISAEPVNTLETLRQEYEQQRQPVLLQYGIALDTAMESLKKKGDLDNLLMLQAEKKRFEAGKTVPVPKDAKDLLRPATEVYYQTLVTVLGQYIKALDDLIKKEVMADRIEAAKVIKAEKDKSVARLTDVLTKVPAKTGIKVESKLPAIEKAATTKPTFILPGGPLKDCVLYYSFDKDEAGAVTDLSGTGHNGVLKGALLVKDAKGKANTVCEFTKGTSLDTNPDEASIAAYKELTLALWMKTAGSDDLQHLVGRTDGGTLFQTPGSFGLILGQEAPLTPSFHFNDGRDQRISFGKKLEKNKWYHLAVVLRPHGIAVGYLDGGRVSSKSGFSKIPLLPKAYFRIGRWDNGVYAYHFVGQIDDVRIYQRALSDSEVKQIFNAQKPQ